MTENSDSRGLSVSALRNALESKIPVALPGTNRPKPPQKPAAMAGENQMNGETNGKSAENSSDQAPIRRVSTRPPVPGKPSAVADEQQSSGGHVTNLPSRSPVRCVSPKPPVPEKPVIVADENQSSGDHVVNSNSPGRPPPPLRRLSLKPPVPPKPNLTEVPQPPPSIFSDDSSSIASGTTLNMTGTMSTTSASSEVDETEEGDDFDSEHFRIPSLQKTSLAVHNAIHVDIMEELTKSGILLKRRMSSRSSTRSSKDMEGFIHDIPPGIGTVRPLAKKGRPQLKEANVDGAPVNDHQNADVATQSRICDSGYQTNSVISEHSVSFANESKEEERLRKLQCAANEFHTMEQKFTDLMHNMFKGYPEYLKLYEQKCGRPLIQESERAFFDQYVIYLSQIYAAHKFLLEQFDKKISAWNSDRPDIASVLTKDADILKICNSFLKEKQSVCTGLYKMMADNKDFEMATRQFQTAVFNNIPLVQQLDSVHQNVARYKILMENYLKYLPEESTERVEAKKAIEKLGNVMEKVNESVADSETAKRLVELHRRLQGHVDVFKPGRKLLEEGNIMKQSRKEHQQRYLVLFNDLLLICKQTLGTDTFDSRSYQISMERVKIVNQEHEELENTFQVKSHVKSFSFIAKDKRERDRWVRMLWEAKRATKKRNSKPKPTVAEEEEDDDDFLPLWIPDRDATKCLMETCTTQFTIVKRRHHCRACGYLICGNCTGKAPIKKRGFVKDKVCPQCYYEIEQASTNGTLFPENMVYREVGTDGRARLRVRYGDGPNAKVMDLNKLFDPPKSGQLKKLPLRSLHRVCSKVHVRTGKGEQIKWAALTDGMVLQFFNAQLDEKPSELYIILGFDMSTTEEDNGTVFQLRHRNQFQTDRKDQVIIFRVEHSVSAEKWLKALTDGLTPTTPNGHTPEH